MEDEKLVNIKVKRRRFCERKLCIFLVLGSVVGAIAVVALLTFLDSNLRFDTLDEQNGLEWWQTRIVYQIYPRSFQDSNGDGVGDLQGIRSRLDYLIYLNVGAIWINPFYKSPMRDFGYDVSDYKQVDPIFGTLDDFDQLVQACSEKDIKLIVDFVPNHTSNDSSWFNMSRYAGIKDNRYRDYYVWHAGNLVNGTLYPPNNWQSNFGGSSWTYDPIRGEYYYHNYLASQPDLNYRNQAVLQEMDSVLRFWLERGVDGFRIDAVTYLFEVKDTHMNLQPGDKNRRRYTKNQPEIFGVIKRWRKIVDEFENTDGKPRMLLAETDSIGRMDRSNYYNSGAVPFYFKLIDAKKLCNATGQCLLTLIQQGLNIEKGQWPNFVIGNHDNSRISDSIGADYVDVMNMMLLTLPGTPTTYYGEELGMRNGNYTGMPPKDTKAISTGDLSKSRDPERNPMQWDDTENAGFTSSPSPWLPVTPNTDYTHVNVKVQKEDPASHLSLYKRLALLRQSPAFQTTAIDLPETTVNMLVYTSGHNSDKYLVILIELPDTATDTLVYTRGHNPDKYVIILNFGQSEVVNLEFLNNLYTRGEVMISSTGRDKQVLELSDVELQKGEGMVVKLLP